MIPTELNVNMRPAIFVQAGDVVGHDLHVNIINIYSSCFWRNVMLPMAFNSKSVKGFSFFKYQSRRNLKFV